MDTFHHARSVFDGGLFPIPWTPIIIRDIGFGPEKGFPFRSNLSGYPAYAPVYPGGAMRTLGSDLKY